jgi:Asp-tRNA(Asn)/Glu-tRNA(Gln) amidotransferase A subunit family amidase
MKITLFSSATELLGRLREGEVSSRKPLESYLQRIERHNPGLNAVVTLDAARARSRADATDARRADRTFAWRTAGGECRSSVGISRTAAASSSRNCWPT